MIKISKDNVCIIDPRECLRKEQERTIGTKSVYKSMEEGKLCYVFVPTTSKLIQAARTKDVLLAGIAG